MTLTLEIPDDLAPRLAAMPEKDRQSYTLAALRLAAVYGPTREPDPVFTPDQLASIGRGLEQLDAGEGIDGDLVMAELYAEAGLENPPVFNRGNPRKRRA